MKDAETRLIEIIPFRWDIELPKKNFAEQIDDVRTKHPDAPTLIVSEPPSVLSEIGMSKRPLLMRSSKINEILDGYHKEITLELFKIIPELIEDSVIAIDSKAHPGKAVVFVTHAKSAEGPIIIPVQKNKYEKYRDPVSGKMTTIKGHTIASIYGKRKFEHLLNYAIDNNSILYYNKDKEKVDKFLASHGASQVPITRLPESIDLNNKIIENPGNVNT